MRDSNGATPTCKTSLKVFGLDRLADLEFLFGAKRANTHQDEVIILALAK